MSDRRIAFGTKLAFGVGQLAEGLKNTSFGMFLMFYYNQVLGVPGTLCGLALGVALIFDAVTDPLAGSLSDGWRSGLGRRHPFMYASALPLALAFFGVFSPPDLGEIGLFLWLIAFTILTRSAMTLYHVPHLALGAEMTENFEERTSLVAYRSAFSYLGGLLAVVIAFAWFFSDARGGRLNGAAYSPYATVLAVLMALTIWVSARGTQREIPFLPKGGDAPQGRILARLLGEVREAFGNASFRWLFSGLLIVALMAGTDFALSLYLYEYFWELSGRHIMALSIAYPIGLVVGTLFSRRLHVAFGRKAGLVLGSGGWAACQVLPIGLRLLGAFPENGTTLLIGALVGFRVLQGTMLQQIWVSMGAMLADVADEQELRAGRRQEGILFGGLAFAGKAAAGLGNIFGGTALDLIGWPRGVESAAEVPADTLLHLAMLYGPVLGGFALLSIWCFTHYRLHRQRHAEILAELARIRSARGSPTAPGRRA